MAPAPNPGWYPDPLRRHQYRFWDGSAWTSHVADAGNVTEDPLGPPAAEHVPAGTPWPAPHPQPRPGAGGGAQMPPAEGGMPPGAGPPAAGPPARQPRPRPSRASLIGAFVVVALVLAVGVVVGARVGGGDDDDDGGGGEPTAVEEIGEGIPRAPLFGGLTLGDTTEPVTEVVDDDGGRIELASGVEIDVPEGAHPEELTYTVSETEIVDHSFGELVNPASALVNVDNGGVVADLPIDITFPVDVDDDEFAAAAFYDSSTGRLELLPIAASDDGELRVMTRHFSSVFVTIVDVALLVSDTIDSGFRPGVDSWQFVNEGSYVASGGHCSGQSLSALWYYSEQKLAQSAQSLFGLYDDRITTTRLASTPSLQWDDRDGYRLASMVQDDEVNAYDAAERRWDDLTAPANGRAQFYAFAYSILLSGEPQYVGMYSSSGGGHAMIVYGVRGDALLISDPNYPTAYREISFNADTGQLGPYRSALSASAPSILFESIGYYGKTALVNWNGLGGRWQQFLDGTIGDGKFPTMMLEVEEEVEDEDGDTEMVWVPLTDGYEVDEDQESIDVRLGSAEGWDDRMRVYSWTTLSVDGRVWNDPVTVPLEEGANRLGFEAIGYEWTGSSEGWVDFRRLTVIRGPLDETPLDLVFVIDLTSSMEDDIDGVKAAASQIVRTIARTSSDWRVAIVGYRDVGDSPMFEDYEFTDEEESVLANINSPSVSGGGDTPEAVYEALSRAIDSSTVGGWRDGVNKQTILMGDAPGHNPGSGDETPESVSRAAELADPVVIQSVVVGNVGYIDPAAQADFANLSALTSGSTFTAADASEVPAALEQSIGATTAAPPAAEKDETNWALVLMLVAALILFVGGAAAVVWRLLVASSSSRARWLVTGAAAAVLGLAGVVGWIVLEGGDDDEPATLTKAAEPEDRETPKDGPVIVTIPPPEDTAPDTTVP